MHTARKKRDLFTVGSLAVLVAACIVTRLPQLFSSHLILDEDECVLGLMAKHMLTGKGVSVFFWGQSYGFSLLETALTALFYIVLGYSDISLKVAMLSIFITGIICFYKTLGEISASRWTPFVVTLIFICCPSWAAWSMKARGGYLTAFFLASLFTWVLLRKWEKTGLQWAILGALFALIFYSQPLWLPGLACLLLFMLLNGKVFARLGYFGLGALPIVLALELVKQHTYNMWMPHVFGFTPRPAAASLLLYENLQGYYYLEELFRAPRSCIWFSILFIALILFLLIAALYRCRHFKLHALFICSVLALLATLAYALFITDNAPRYLLPLTGFSLLSFFCYLNSTRRHIVLQVLPAVYLTLGVSALLSFSDFKFLPYSKKDLLSCIDYLRGQHISYCFCNDVPYEWQIMFYSKEDIICRGSEFIDRNPAYVARVNAAWLQHPGSTAVVDVSGDIKSMEPLRTVTVAGKFFVLRQPTARFLKDMDLEFSR